MTASTPLRSASACQRFTASAPDQPDRACGVDVVERAGEGDDADAGGHDGSLLHGPVLDHGVGQQRFGDLGERFVGDAVVDFELKPLALPDI